MHGSRKIVAFLLVASLVWQAGEPQAWASPAQAPDAAWSALFAEQTLTGRFVAGYTGPTPSIFVRRQAPRLAIAALAFTAVLAHGQTLETPSTPSVEEARSFHALQERMLDVSKDLRHDFHVLEAAEKNREAEAARNIAITTTQNDLTHSPRLPLGNASATPGPLSPSLEDVIARANEQIDGPVRRWESLEQKENGFWSTLVETFRTLAFKGGYTRNSDAKVALSWENEYLAAIDVEDAATLPFEHMDARWQELQTQWFDLGLMDVEARRLSTVKRFKQKKWDEATYLLAQGHVDNPQAKTEELIQLQREIDAADDALKTLTGKQNALAGHLVITYLRNQDADKQTAATAETYRPRLPQLTPSLGLIERILIDIHRPLDRHRVQAFRQALKDQLHLSDAQVPADPFSRESRRLVLDRLWTLGHANASIPMAGASETDPTYTLSTARANALLAQPQNDLLKRAPAPPEQATLFVRIKRSFELAKMYKLQELRQWSFNLFIKLGLDLPVQFSSQNTQPIDVARNALLIGKEESLRKAVNDLLDATQDKVDDEVKTARTNLESARENVREAARQTADTFDQIPTVIAYGSQQVSDWEDPAFELEMRLALLEQRLLEMEKAYRVLDYVVSGRTALRNRLEEKRRAFFAPATTPTPSPAKAPAPRPDLSLPGPLKKAAGLLLAASPIAAAADHSLIRHLFTAPVWADGALYGAALVSLFFVAHWRRHRFKDEKEIRFGYWAALGAGAAITFPGGAFLGVGGPLWGLAFAALLGTVGWFWSPEFLSGTYKPGSLGDNATHLFNSRPAIKRYGLRLAVIIAGAWFVVAPVWHTTRTAGRAFFEFISARGMSENATGFQRVRWPISYTPPQTGTLVRTHLPGPDGVLHARYLVRWIGPKTDPSAITDAVFVFQTTSNTGAVEDELVAAHAQWSVAEAALDALRAQSRLDAIPDAEAEVRMAQARLQAAQTKTPLRDEPLPTSAAIEIDPTLSPAKVNTEARAGVPMVLAYQKSSRAGLLKLTLSPDEYAALGTGMAEPARKMRMRFTTDDDGDVVIPVAAIQKLERATRGSATNARERDEAKGGFQQIFRDASIYLSDAMLHDAIPHYVPPETLAFLQTLNNEEQRSISALTFKQFEEWKDGHWVPYSETLPANVVMADAELEATPAPTPHVALPQVNAAIDASEALAEIHALETAQRDLRAQLANLGHTRSAAIARSRQEIENKITVNEGRLQALRASQRHTAMGVQVRAETGVAIPARTLEKVEGPLWIYAPYRIARLLNPETEQQSAANAAPGVTGPSDVFPWNAHALVQVRDGAAVIRVRTALESFHNINDGPWEICFPGVSKPVTYNKAVDLSVDDVIQDLSQGGLIHAFPLNTSAQGPGARALIPVPGSLIPVRFVIPATSESAPTAEAQQPANDSGSSTRTDLILYGAAGALLAGAGALTRRTLRLRQWSHRPAQHLQTEPSNRPFDRAPLEITRPSSLTSRTAKQLERLQTYLAKRFLDIEQRGLDGRLLEPHERIYKKFGPSVLSPSDAKFLSTYWEFTLNHTKPNQRLVHFRWTFVVSVLVILLATRGAIQDLKTSIFPGNPTIDILRIKVAAIDWHHLPAQILQHPNVVLNHAAITIFLFALLTFVVLAITWVTGQITPAAIRQAQITWYWAQNAEARVNDFEHASREWSPDGSAVNFEEEMAKVRPNDQEGRKDERRLVFQDREEFMQAFWPFADMMTRRAARTLWKNASAYLNEKPEALYIEGRSLNELFTNGNRRVAADARWWAAVFEDVARSVASPNALIPFTDPGHPLDKLQDHPLYSDEEIRTIAIDILGMDVKRIRRELPITDAVERERVVRRIEAEYLDRAKVLWAIDEMEKRPVRAFVAIDAIDALGWAMAPTGDAEADRGFDRGAVENVLEEYHKRLPTLLPEAEKLRQKSKRETPMFQGYRYIAGGFGVPDPDEQELGDTPRANGDGEGAHHGMNSNLAAAFPTFLKHPDTGTPLIRETGKYGEPTFEGLALPYYRTGYWKQELIDRLRDAMARKAGFTVKRANEKIAHIQTVLKKMSTRRYIAWSIDRLLQKTAPGRFNDLIETLRGTPNRDLYDLRYLSDPAPLMDDQDRTLTTNADLKIAEFKYRSLLEKAIAAAGPILGYRDFLGDLALEINPKMGAQDASLDARMIDGDVQQLAMSAPSDEFAGDLGLRIPTRAPNERTRIRVRTSKQAEPLLAHPNALMDSILEISPQPPHASNAVNPYKTDPSLHIIITPNLYLKYAARLLFFKNVLPADEREAVLARMGAYRAEFERELDQIEPLLERMNIRVKVYDTWDDAILDHDVPAEDDDHSYNTIVFIAPNARPNLTPGVEHTVVLGDTRLVEKDHVTRGAKVLLDDTEFGAGGKGAIYNVIDGVDFSLLPKGFLQLRDKANRVLAIRYYHRNDLRIGAETIPTIYHSWTTTAKAVRRQGVAERFSTLTLDEFKKKLGGVGMAVANIEDDNKPVVQNILKRGYVQIGEYDIGYVGKLAPRASPSMRPATPADRDAILSLLHGSYAAYDFTDFDASTFDATDGYYVWEENGRIVAVINGHPQIWQFRKLKGWLLESVGHRLHDVGAVLALAIGVGVTLLAHAGHSTFFNSPAGILVLALLAASTLPLRWTFYLKNHRFLKLGDIAYAPGQAATAGRLIEAVMAEKKLRMAWGFFDHSGRVYQELKRTHIFGYTGFLNLLAETKLHTYAYGFDSKSRAVIQDLHQKLTTVKAGKRRPTFIPYRHLAWIAGPMILGGLLGITTPMKAAVLAPTGMTMAHKTMQAVAQYVVQPGDSWWSISRTLLHRGADYHQLMAANAGHGFMLHPGDLLNAPGLLAPQMPMPPMPSMPTFPLPTGYQWLAHPTPEALLVAILAGTAMVAFGVWWWKRRAARRLPSSVVQPTDRGWPWWIVRPAMAALMALGLLAQTAAPIVAPAPVPPATEALAAEPDLNAPAPPLPVSTTEKTALPWIRYANARLLEAAAVHAQPAQAHNPQALADQLRLEYLALLARRQAEQLSPVPVSAPAKPHHSWIRRMTTPFAKLGQTTWRKMRPKQIEEPVYDAEFDILKARVVDAIRAAKRDLALGQASEDDVVQLRDALTQPVDIPNVPEEQRFETVFGPLWEDVDAGRAQLAEDIAAARQEAAVTPMHVNGTDHLSEATKHAQLNAEAARAEQTARRAAIQQAIESGIVDADLGLSAQFAQLGLAEEAAQSEAAGLLRAHEAGLLPNGKPLFRTAIDHVVVLNSEELNRDPALAAQLTPMIERADAAAERFAAVTQDALDRETAWQWKRALAHGADLSARFPEEHAALVRALTEERTVRQTLLSNERALIAALRMTPNAFRFERHALQEPTAREPDDATLAHVEAELLTASAATPTVDTLESDDTEAPLPVNSRWTTAPPQKTPLPVATRRLIRHVIPVNVPAAAPTSASASANASKAPAAFVKAPAPVRPSPTPPHDHPSSFYGWLAFILSSAMFMVSTVMYWMTRQAHRRHMSYAEPARRFA